MPACLPSNSAMAECADGRIFQAQLILPSSCRGAPSITFSSQMRKLRLRELKKLTEGHTVYGMVTWALLPWWPTQEHWRHTRAS